MGTMLQSPDFRLPDEDGHVLTIIGHPKSQAQATVLAEFVSNLFRPEEGAEESMYCLPYQQGAGWTKVVFADALTADQQEKWEDVEGEYLGMWAQFGYADSMGGFFTVAWFIQGSQIVQTDI